MRNFVKASLALTLAASATTSVASPNPAATADAQNPPGICYDYLADTLAILDDGTAQQMKSSIKPDGKLSPEWQQFIRDARYCTSYEQQQIDAHKVSMEIIGVSLTGMVVTGNRKDVYFSLPATTLTPAP